MPILKDRRTTTRLQHDRLPPVSSVHIQTTLYDLMDAMHDEVSVGEEDLVVTAILYLVHGGRLPSLSIVPDDSP